MHVITNTTHMGVKLNWLWGLGTLYKRKLYLSLVAIRLDQLHIIQNTKKNITTNTNVHTD